VSDDAERGDPARAEASHAVVQSTLDVVPEAGLSVWGGVRVLVPRAEGQAVETAALLRERGALPLLLPTIRLEPPPDPGPARRAAERVDSYDLVLFTSANAVRCFAAFLARANQGPWVLPAGAVRAVGSATGRALEGLGVRVPTLPGRFLAEAFLEHLAPELTRLRTTLGRSPRVLLPRALEAREVLPEGLLALGCEVEVVPVYATLPAEPAVLQAVVAALRARELDVVLLTSGSTVESLAEALGQELEGLLAEVLVASLGPITTGAARARGVRVDVTSPTSTLPALLAALEPLLLSRLRRGATP
jgi:uroporphyrinogen III methyltransferase/synthase